MAYDVALRKQKLDAINYVQLKPDYEVINYKIKNDLKESVIKNQSKIWSPDIKSKYKSVETNSCYDMKNVVKKENSIDKKKPKEKDDEVPKIEFVNDLDEVKKQKKIKKKKTKNNDNDDIDDEKADVFIKTQQVIILPSISQKNIIQSWFSAYIDMYNATIRFIKKLFNLSLLHKMKELKGYKLYLENKLKQLLKTRTKFEKVKKSLLKMMFPNKKTKKNFDNTHIKLQYSECKKDIKDININISNTNNLIAQTTSELNKYETKFKSVFNYKNLRTKYLKGIRNSIIKKHCYQNNEDNAIYVHIMDTSIKLACSNFKSAITNFMEGHNKGFRIRYWKHTKDRKIMEIEKSFLKNGIICKDIIGKMRMKYYDSGEWVDYELIPDGAIKLHYDLNNDIYSIYVPKKTDQIEKIAPAGTYIGLDPGIRTFMTGISDKDAIKLGTEIGNKIKSLLERIDHMNSREEYPENKKENIKKYNNMIKNMVDEMHWKIINYLTIDGSLP